MLAEARADVDTGWALRDGQGGMHPLRGRGPWLIGRAVEADVRFADDPFCARRQCELKLFPDDSLAIRPVSDKNPVHLDGKVLERPARLSDGAAIRFGQTTLTLTRQRGEAKSQGSADQTFLSHANQETVIGRMPGGTGVAIDHPAVSRKHAAFWHRDGQMWLRDLGSFNGTFVNGERIAAAVALAESDVVSVGPVQLRARGNELVLLRRSGAAAITARDIAVDVGSGASHRRILHPCVLEIGRGEFVALIGGSGAGKSTLMNVLSGRRAADEGRVEIHRLDVVAQFDALKSFVAYLPQREALHGLLTVRQALGYVAELRLPLDTTAAERAVKIAGAAAAVDLTAHLDTAFSRLSGGQKKRACLAAEILCEPDVMFLDEVTSGLDEETDFEIMHLLKRLAAERRMTIVCVTHTLANIPACCDRVVVMAPGGHLVFEGAPGDALAHFRIEALGEVFRVVNAANAAEMAQRRPTTDATPDAAEPAPRPATAAPGQGAMRVLNQFAVLIRRNMRLLLADRATLQLVIVQALAIGLFVGWAFSTKAPDALMAAAKNKMLIALLVMSVFWMGCSGASKDIVGETQILAREKAVNLSLAAYLTSRLVVGFVFVAAQVALMLVVVLAFLGSLPGDPGPQLVILLLCGLLAVSMGLLISAAVASPQEATALVPILLVPQLILIGTIVPDMPRALNDFAAALVPTNVLNAAMLAVYGRSLAHGIPEMPSPPDFKAHFMALRDLHALLRLAIAQLAVIVVATWAALGWRYRRGAGGG